MTEQQMIDYLREKGYEVYSKEEDEERENDFFHLSEDYKQNVIAKSKLRKELKEIKGKFESGQAVILPTGAIDVLKLLTCASICYQHIYENMVENMAKSKDIGNLFMKSPMPQGTTLRTALYELMQSDIDCNKITGIDDVLNAMPSFKEYLKEAAEAKLKKIRGE